MRSGTETHLLARVCVSGGQIEPLGLHVICLILRIFLLRCHGRGPAWVLPRGACRPAVGAGGEGEGAHQGVFCFVFLAGAVGMMFLTRDFSSARHVGGELGL